MLGAFLLWFGWFYATVDDMLWFHAAAVPEAARGDVRPLYFALMNLIGGSAASLGLLGVTATIGLLRRGDVKAAVALAVAYAIPFVMAGFTAEELAAATGAPTSWHIMGALTAATAVALITHVASCAGRRGGS
jgi:hypothetical protein